MKKSAVCVGVLGAIGLGACAPTEAGMEPAGSASAMATAAAGATVAADVRNAIGQSKARATATQTGDSIRVRLEASGMPRGSYGAHIHMTGRCDAPEFTTAGGHWNPTGQQHGKNNPRGMHKGDLPNLLIGTDGRGSVEMTIPGAALLGEAMPMLDADGASLVIHAQADDYRTDPSGNSGGRIACGVFG